MDSDLYRAAISGDTSVLREKEDQLGDEVTPDKSSVLHLASEAGKTEFVQEILKLHPSLLCERNSKGETALHLAAREGHSPVVRALIDEAIKRSSFPKDDLESGVASSVKEMLIRMVNEEKGTALHEAARYNHLDVVKMLVEEDREDSHTPNNADETPLYLAAYRGYFDVVKAICATCSSPAYRGSDGRTALHAAIISLRSECVTYLLGWKKDLIKETDKHGWTAFHYAAYFNLNRTTEELLKVDRSVAYLADKTGGRTALHVAATGGSIDVMKELIKFCPDCFDMVDQMGQNVLHIAVEHDNKEMIGYILENCPLINRLVIQKDNNGNTILHLLAISGCFVPKLIHHKMADKEALNNQNLTPFDILHGDYEYIADQRKVAKTIQGAGANLTWRLWSAIREGVELKIKKAETEDAKEAERVRKIGDTHMIVAALIATVTFTAGFTLPGGYNGNEGPNQGLAILTRKAAFKTFIVTDTIALVLSTASLVIYFIAAMYRKSDAAVNFYIASFFLNVVAIGAMMIAFITGSYAGLAHSSALAIVVCLIGSSFFLILFFIFRKCNRAIEIT